MLRIMEVYNKVVADIEDSFEERVFNINIYRIYRDCYTYIQQTEIIHTGCMIPYLAQSDNNNALLA